MGVMARGADDPILSAEELVAAVRTLSGARTAGEIFRILSRSARRLLGADGCGLVLVEGLFGYYKEEDGAAPGWKGRRIPLDGCLAGWCAAQRRPVMIEDVRADIRLPVAALWSTPVTAVAMVPVRSRDPLGAFACYWTARHSPSAQDLSVLQALADSASLALDNATMRATLDDRVGRRTSELEELNRRLHREVAERKRAEDEVRQLSLVDELTGLYNRRGFNLLAGRELKAIQRSGRRALVIYIDIDGLKQANDSHGHEAGDRLLARAAAVLRSVTREVDVAARVGGDEFVVFMTLGYDPPPVHLIVERFLDAARTHDVKWSIGATATPWERQVTLDDLLFAADQAMYRGRRTRRRERRVALGP
jgi:diguanylate cyclase (GGDEF)-like protein